MALISGVLAGGPGATVKIFRGRQKLEKGANDARTPFVGRNSEFGKTEELFNSLGGLCFAEGRVSLPVRLHLVWLSAGGVRKF